MLFITFLAFESCKTSEAKTNQSMLTTGEINNNTEMEKSGAQLWGESCVRCHNAPPPQAYSNEQWEVIGKHMRVRANITQEKVDKIISFIKSSN